MQAVSPVFSGAQARTNPELTRLDLHKRVVLSTKTTVPGATEPTWAFEYATVTGIDGHHNQTDSFGQRVAGSEVDGRVMDDQVDTVNLRFTDGRELKLHVGTYALGQGRSDQQALNVGDLNAKNQPAKTRGYGDKVVTERRLLTEARFADLAPQLANALNTQARTIQKQAIKLAAAEAELRVHDRWLTAMVAQSDPATALTESHVKPGALRPVDMG